MGIRFSLDDFGTGYSSLTYFHQLPFDMVKIDRNFVSDMLVKPEDLAIVEGVLRMAKAMPSPVLAEGVESLEVGLMLYQLGCQFGQGFGIAPPLPAAQVPRWVEAWQANRPWHDLAAAVHAETRSVDLNVAIYSLRCWLDQSRAYLRGDEGVELPILDEYQCQFCRSYKGIGEARFGRKAQYALIQALHHQLHALVAGLVEKAKAGKGKRRRARLAELDALGEELIGRVRALGD